MKLLNIYETLSRYGTRTMYKGMSVDNFRKFKRHNIPGFMAELTLAMIYAEPTLTGNAADTRILISASIDLNTVDDRSDIVKDMCFDWALQHPELRSEIWTAPGSGHSGLDAIYYGQPLRGWVIAATFKGQDAWKAAFEQLRSDGKLRLDDMHDQF